MLAASRDNPASWGSLRFHDAPGAGSPDADPGGPSVGTAGVGVEAEEAEEAEDSEASGRWAGAGKVRADSSGTGAQAR